MKETNRKKEKMQKKKKDKVQEAINKYGLITTQDLTPNDLITSKPTIFDSL